MTVFLELAIPIADVAKEIKSTPAKVEAEALALLMFVGHDWAGRPALSVTDAHSIVTGSARREQEHATAWHDHLVATEAWEAERAALNVKVRDEAYIKGRTEGRSDAACRALAREATSEAIEQWEREHPAPVFEDGGEPIARNWFAKVKEAVR